MPVTNSTLIKCRTRTTSPDMKDVRGEDYIPRESVLYAYAFKSECVIETLGGSIVSREPIGAVARAFGFEVQAGAIHRPAIRQAGRHGTLGVSRPAGVTESPVAVNPANALSWFEANDTAFPLRIAFGNGHEVGIDADPEAFALLRNKAVAGGAA